MYLQSSMGGGKGQFHFSKRNVLIRLFTYMFSVFFSASGSQFPRLQ